MLDWVSLPPLGSQVLFVSHQSDPYLSANTCLLVCLHQHSKFPVGEGLGLTAISLTAVTELFHVICTQKAFVKLKE